MENQTIQNYLTEHCITEDVIKKYNLVIKNDRIEIPVYDSNGEYIFSKIRMFVGDDKYKYSKRGTSMALFNAHRITKQTTLVVVVEGEFDAMVLEEYSHKEQITWLTVVSSTGGAGSWKKEWNGFLKGKRVEILLDNDKAGMNGAFKLWETIGQDVSNISILVLGTPANSEYKDVCEMMYKLKDIYTNTVITKQFDYYNIVSARNDREKMKVLKQMFEWLNDFEAESFTFYKKKYISAFREYLAKIEKRERPRPARKKILQGGDITLDRLREIPITNFIKFNSQGLAKCIFHSDSDPSMRYNHPQSRFPNTVKCFSCGKFAGIVDVVMQLNNCTFTEAVDILKKHL